MKILIICSSLEPGKDGVGDYTRRLATELHNRNCEVLLCSIKDRFLHSTDETFESQIASDLSIPIYRYRELNCSTLEKINTILSRMNPDKVLLQFVPYGFHSKGLPFSLPNKLNTLLKSYSTQIMFHEL